MLGPNKWRLLTIVAGILLAHAIDSPNRSARRINQPSQYASLSLASRAIASSPTSTHLGLSVEKVAPAIRNSKSSNVDSFRERRLARNLYTPFERFSNIDDVRYVERQRTTGNRNDLLNSRTTFGAFRYASLSDDDTAGRRSDDNIQFTAFEYTNGTQPDAVSGVIGGHLVTTITPTTLQAIKRQRYRYIPLGAMNENTIESSHGTHISYQIEHTTLPNHDIRSRTDGNLERSKQHSAVHREHLVHEQMAEPSETMPQALALHSEYQSSISNKLAFPARSKAVISSQQQPTRAYSEIDDDIQGRRSGITFTQHTPKFDPPFVPQPYQEDDPSHPNFQNPYSEELSPTEANEVRQTRGTHYDPHAIRSPIVHFPGPGTSHNVKPFRDDVTKFGDANGPVTSLQQRQYSDFFGDGIRTFDNTFYSDDFRRPHTQSFYSAAPKTPFYELGNDYQPANQPLRSRLIVPYKSSRTPRVIFPSSDNLNGVYNTESYNANDNIVFR